MAGQDRPKIGLALGSGGTRGLAHIGVLKKLLEHEIPIDFIAGSSIGSFIGALYAVQQDLGMLVKLAQRLKRKHWMDFTVPGLGFIQGDKVKELIRLLSHGKNLEDLPIPLAVVATDLERGERVVFRSGPIDVAVRASIAIPGIFVPEKVDGRLLVDGGVVDRVPVTVVREMGADLVIAVDVASYKTEMKVNSIFEVITRAIDVMEMEIMRSRILDADFLIRPQPDTISSVSFEEIDECVSEGERAAEEMIPLIKQKLAERVKTNDEEGV